MKKKKKIAVMLCHLCYDEAAAGSSHATVLCHLWYNRQTAAQLRSILTYCSVVSPVYDEAAAKLSSIISCCVVLCHLCTMRQQQS
jgi:hypothetical protein